MVKWQYKDNHRNYWRFEVRDSGIRHGEYQDFEWYYSVFLSEIDYSEKEQQPTFRGVLVGQQDLPPKLGDILLDWLGYLNGVALGAVLHAHKED